MGLKIPIFTVTRRSCLYLQLIGHDNIVCLSACLALHIQSLMLINDVWVRVLRYLTPHKGKI